MKRICEVITRNCFSSSTSSFDMAFEGTDDDYMQTQHQRVPAGGRSVANGQTTFDSVSHQKMQSDMELEIHNLERVAYGPVLRALKAQSNALTWAEQVLDASSLDELELDRAKKSLKEHEQTLIQAIAKLTDACDDDGDHPSKNRHSSGRQHKVDYHGQSKPKKTVGKADNCEPRRH